MIMINRYVWYRKFRIRKGIKLMNVINKLVKLVRVLRLVGV